ncbi:MAG: hypothetical protein OEV33_01905 [Armatimonadota bacterium]|nr:hypothetical protein [Armatimonadota bacterium]
MTRTSHLSLTHALLPLVVALLLCAIPAAAAQSGPVVLDDQDWRGPDLVARADGVEHKLISSLLLYTEMAELVFLFDPTDDETITTITDFKGKLYLGSCTRPSETETGSVFTYDPETHAWEKVFQVNEEGLVRLEVYGDRLYIPGYDANDGDWDLGNIYVHDGETWVEHRTVPRAVHIYGLAVYKDRIYVSADVMDEPPPGKHVEEAYKEGLIGINGGVMSSSDGCLTWREEHRGLGQDAGFMTVFDDRLIVNAGGDLLTFDGHAWQQLGLNPNALVVLDYVHAGQSLLMGTSVGLAVFDGGKLQPLTPWDGMGNQIRAIRRFGERWIYVSNFVAGGTLRHGPGGTGYMNLKDDEEKPFASWLKVMPEVFFRATVLRDEQAQQELREHGMSEFPRWIYCDEMLVSAHAFKGRLFLGTHPDGRVLVLPVATEGMLDAAPRALAKPGKYVLYWEAATPEGTSCGLQVRSAPDLASLNGAPFTGPGGEADNLYEASGAIIEMPDAGFVQYRVVMKTENPALSPYLKRVTLRAAN